MPTDAFLRAAQMPGRQMVAAMSIESVAAVVRRITAQADWQASKTLSASLNTVDAPGDVNLRTRTLMYLDGVSNYQGVYSSALPFDCWVRDALSVTLHWTGNVKSYTPPPTVRFSLRSGSRTGTVLATVDVIVTFARMDGSLVSAATIPVVPFPPTLVTAGTVLAITVDVAPIGAATTVEEISQPFLLELVAKEGSLRTLSIDLGLDPTEDTVVQIDDVVPLGSSLSLTARGSDDNSAWTNLGAVADGGTLAPYRYYDFDVAFVSAGSYELRLSEISVSGGDSQFRRFSTHRDEPIAGTLPHVISVSPLTSKIELTKGPTTGEATLKMHWTREVGDLLATGYLKNKAVWLEFGYTGLSIPDYEPLLTGVWYDYSADPVKREISVKVRDVLKTWAKRKLPREDFNATTGARETTAIVWSGDNIMQAMIDVLDEMGVPDRFIDRDAYAALAAGARSGTDWQVSRTIGGLDGSGNPREPIAAETLLEELSVLAGVFLVPLPSGRITPVLYDPEGTPVATWDAHFVDQGGIEGGQKELFTAQIIYYDPLTLNPGENPEDYAKGHVNLNATAEVAWGEAAEKRWYDKWGASSVAIAALGTRWSGWFSEPRFTVKVGAPLRHAGVVPGQIVSINNLRLPCASSQWPGLTHGRRFLVLSRRLDPAAGKLDFDLLDTGIEDAPLGADTWQNPVVVSGNTAPYWHQLNYYTVSGGTAPYVWAASGGVLTPNGDSATLDISGLIGSVTISATDANGNVGILQVFPQPFAAPTSFNVTIASGVVGADLAGFPVMVRLSDMPASFWDKTRTDGGDIRVKTAAGEFIPIDISRFDYAAQDGVLFFRAPSVLAGSDNIWQIQVGGSYALLPASDPYGRNAVWTDYDAVYLFGETPEDRTGGAVLKVNLDPNFFETIETSPDLNAHQGVASDDVYYYISDTNALKKYDLDWNLVTQNTDPLGDSGIAGLNHMGDIECRDGKIYAIIEVWPSGPYVDQHIAVFNASDLSFIESFDISAQGHEGSSIAWCPPAGCFYITSHADGRKLYKYSASGQYLGSLSLALAPGGGISLTDMKWQGITWWRGVFWLASDKYDETYRVLPDGTIQWSGVFGQSVPTGFFEGLGHTTDALLQLIDNGAGNKKVLLWKPLDVAKSAGGGLSFPADANVRGNGHYVSGTFTVGVSFALSDKSQNRAVLSFWDESSGATNVRATLAYSTAQAGFGLWDSVNGWILPSPALDPVMDTVYRAHAVYAGASHRKIYIDGTLKNTGSPVSALPSGLDTLLFGREDDSNNEAMRGLVGFAYLRDGELPADWIAAEYANMNTPESFYLISEV
jgi:hypothetical protein